ncbi:hypothetical protein SUGI_1110430 [Cryptomeria japonica]|uniref:uncharacterized protein LOC131038359 n=1 Tax=Cryptomeria japonica TaxID=3369 RepID=UPI0024149EE5|nr:uncharacterized protein LOC131038359 [Cryptomeria japonica]GLJ52203.1 hypothetical protein SUGI_1110430 [Cryptomeria japonica]
MDTEDSHRGQPSSLRCRRCAAPLSKDLEESSWSLAPFIRDSFSMIGTTVGGSASAFYGFNHGMPPVQRLVKGPMWLQFLIGAPPIMLFSATCAGLSGGAVPALAQLAVSSYHAALMRSHSSISQVTMRMDELHKVTSPLPHSRDSQSIPHVSIDKNS